MKTLHKNILKDMIRQVSSFLVTDSEEIKEWSVSEGEYSDYGVFTRYSKEPVLKHLGDSWVTGYHKTTWFSSSFVITDKFVGKKLYLEIEFGGEALVRINGKIVGAISSKMNSGWVFRDKIFLPIYEKSGEKLEIELEGTVNSAGFCDYALDGAESETYIMKRARVIAVDEECEQYIFDVETVFNALDFVEDRYINARLYEALDESLHTIDFDFDRETGLKSVYKASKKLKEEMKKISYIPQSTVYMTGHCHIDIAWLWDVRETVRKTARTMSNNLELMERYPDLVFTQSQAIIYDFCKKYYPDIYERIKQKVKEGTWKIEGNSWVEADTNIASGESLIRQLLYGREFFKKEFGVVSDTYWLPDCFGFSWALPQIIKRSGMKYFVSAKLKSQDTNPFPMSTFKWKGADSSEILAHIVKGGGYGGECSVANVSAYDRANLQSDVLPATLGMFGYGDGGGGCTYGMVERARRIDKMPGLPNVRISSSSSFFKEAEKSEKNLPTWYDEMYYENHRGTYSSQALIKKYNRKSEFLLTRTEMLCALSENVLAGNYPKEKLEDIWKLLMKNQFHDTLPGTSIHSAHEDAHEVFEKLIDDAQKIKDDTIKKLNFEISCEKDGIIVWNMFSQNMSGFVKVEIENENLSVVSEGKSAASHITKENGKTYLEFFAEDVPQTGYKFFETAEIKRPSFKAVKATKRLLENDNLKVKFDKNAVITSVYDKKNEREILCGKGNLLTIFQDKPIHESAWNIELNYQKKFTELIVPLSVEVICSDEVKGVIRVKRKYNNSLITQDIVLRRNSSRIDFETTVDWHETEKTLKASFEVDIVATKATYEIAHGSIERNNHWSTSYDLAKFEVAAHKWADLSEGGYGVSVLNDCKYGYDVKENRMRITLLRSPNCPDRTSDRGINTFTYSLYPHEGRWDESTVEEAFKLNLPLEGYVKKATDGKLPEKMSLISFDSDNIVLDAYKKSQDETADIFRVYESKKRRGKVTATLCKKAEKIVECNMMEDEENEIASSCDSFCFNIKPGEVKTFKIFNR